MKKTDKTNNLENKGGRPNEYLPEELKEKAIEYFTMCDETIIKRGINGIFTKPKTISGLNLYLKVGKNYLSEKLKDDRFSGTVEHIRLVVENDIEEKALVGTYSPSASSFNLKNNFGWKDSQNIEFNDNTELTKEQKEKELKMLNRVKKNLI